MKSNSGSGIMEPDLYIHPTTKTQLNALAKSLPHALLIEGDEGIGLNRLAYYVAQQAELSEPQIITKDDKGSIGIAVIRDLYQQTRAKTQNRLIIIDDADTMTIEAQNAFLKLLEEPSAAISFALLSHRPNLLLPTIRSRVQQLSVHRITTQQTDELLTELGVDAPDRRAQLKFIAGGLPAELSRLSIDEAYFEAQAAIIRDARQLLQASDYEKLLIIHRYSSRESALRLTETLIRLLSFSLRQKPQKPLIEQLKRFSQADAHMRENGHVRLQMLRAILGSF